MKYLSLGLFISGLLWFFSIMFLNYKFFPEKRNFNRILSFSVISDYRDVIQSEKATRKKRQLKFILALAILLTINYFFQIIYIFFFR